jgi:hypothetical protein
MNDSNSEIILLRNPPEIPQLMDNVIRTFVRGIPGECYQYCKLVGHEDIDITKMLEDERNKHLGKFVRERLMHLAKFEYVLWINGRLPFVTHRELHLWRLLQFVMFIWCWNLPDDDDVSRIFNLTKRQASSLVNDFIARFRKTLLFPVVLRRLYCLLRATPWMDDVDHPKKKWTGALFRITSKRYIEDTNTLIDEFRDRINGGPPLPDAYLYDRDENIMWIAYEVLKIVRDNDKIRVELFRMYPLPAGGNNG